MAKKPLISFDFACFIFFTGLTVFSIIIWAILMHYAPELANSILQLPITFFSGTALSSLIIILRNKYEEKGNQWPVFGFLIKKSKIGVLKIYAKRRETDKKGYIHDLLKEFKNLENRHKKNDDPIKMIGAALESYFGTDKILSTAINEYCSDAYFRILICSKSNRELRSKFDKLLLPEEKGDKTLDDMPLIKDIDYSISSINTMNNNGHLDYRLYKDFSPYATIIIIKDKIYYTPNMTIFESEYSNSEQFRESELSFCIKRESSAGKKLEENFNRIWNAILIIPLETK